MSTNYSEQELRALDIPCPTCGAEPSYPCEMGRGSTLRFPDSPKIHPERLELGARR